MNRLAANHLATILGTLILLFSQAAYPADPFDVEKVPQDLITPPVTDGPPAPGRRVRQFHPTWEGTNVYHALYLPVDWQAGEKYPVIVEYAGNKWQTSPGTVEGSNLGYGISAGRGVIWICMPFVDVEKRTNAANWWGDVEATVSYCKDTVQRICREYGGDSSAVFLAGFSRGAIACNYIGLHDDEISSLWRGFICHSHYDGVRKWPGPMSDRASAIKRLRRLGDRPQWVSHEKTVDETADYLGRVCPTGNFTFRSMSFANHTDRWVLRDVPERTAVRKWFQDVVAGSQPK